MQKITLSLLDDETLITQLLHAFFSREHSIEQCSSYNHGDAFLEDLEKGSIHPEILILDLSMKGMSGLDVMEILKEKFPSIKIIVMSSHYKKSFMGFMLKTGATAFISKGTPPQKLLEIVLEVHEKGFYFDVEQINAIREQVSKRAPQPQLNNEANLSEREIEILRLICLQKLTSLCFYLV